MLRSLQTASRTAAAAHCMVKGSGKKACYLPAVPHVMACPGPESVDTIICAIILLNHRSSTVMMASCVFPFSFWFCPACASPMRPLERKGEGAVNAAAELLSSLHCPTGWGDLVLVCLVFALAPFDN
jgi:hypothetical protein